jgi:hypothetical protein
MVGTQFAHVLHIHTPLMISYGILFGVDVHDLCAWYVTGYT